MPSRPKKKPPLRQPSGLRTVPIGFYPDSEAAAWRIQARMPDGAKFTDAVRLAVIEYDRLCAAGLTEPTY
jgi:hypothetical protein